MANDKVITYGMDGKIKAALLHECLRCDKGIIIDGPAVKLNELFFCTYCGLDSRMSLDMVQTVHDSSNKRPSRTAGHRSHT